MSDPSERDEPSFVTNIERSLDPRVPSPLGPPKLASAEDEELEATEVGTVPGPRLHRLHDDGDEPVENTQILVTPEGAAHLAQLPPMRPQLDSEAAGHWLAPGPNGAPLPISSDTAALNRSELVAPPTMPLPMAPMGTTASLGATAAAFPSVPPPVFAPPQPMPSTPPRIGSVPSAAAITPPRRRRGSAIYLFWFLVVGVIGGAGLALKLGIVRRTKPALDASTSVSAAAIASSAPAIATAPGVPSAPSPTASTTPPSDAPSAVATAEPADAGTPTPAGSARGGRRGRPRRPRRGK